MKVWGLPRNPAADVERPRTRVSDDLEAFSPEEVWALVRAAASERDAALFLTAAFTGLRMGELLALQWRDVDFAGDAIRVRRSYNIHGGVGTPKSGKVRSVPMVPDVARQLARLSEREEFVDDDELVFPNDIGRYMDASSLRDRYKAAIARAGLRPLRFHEYADVRVMPMSLRRGCSERFLRSGGRHNQSASRKARSVSVGR
jgi:integrase